MHICMRQQYKCQNQPVAAVLFIYCYYSPCGSASCYGQPFFFLCLSFKRHNVDEKPTGIPADDDKGSVEGRYFECSPIVMMNAALANSQSISKISRLCGMGTHTRLFIFSQDVTLTEMFLL